MSASSSMEMFKDDGTRNKNKKDMLQSMQTFFNDQVKSFEQQDEDKARLIREMEGDDHEQEQK